MGFINAAAHIGLLWLTTAVWETQAPSPARAGFGGDPPPLQIAVGFRSYTLMQARASAFPGGKFAIDNP